MYKKCAADKNKPASVSFKFYKIVYTSIRNVCKMGSSSKFKVEDRYLEIETTIYLELQHTAFRLAKVVKNF